MKSDQLLQIIKMVTENLLSDLAANLKPIFDNKNKKYKRVESYI